MNSSFNRLGEVCKHVGALLYYIASEVRKGNNKTCTSRQQAWGKPSAKARKRYSACKLSSVAVRKAKIRSDITLLPGKSLIGRRSHYDPRRLTERQPMSLELEDLKTLATATEGKCGLLLYTVNPWKDFKPEVPDLENVINEEVVTEEDVFEEPQSVSMLAEEILSQLPMASVADKVSKFFTELSLTVQQQEHIATLTKGQSKTLEWSKFRAGLITATKLLPVVAFHSTL